MKSKALKKSSKTDWERIATMPDSDIDTSDAPELDASFFENAILRLPKPKKPISLRLDDDVLSWFKKQGKGYQTRINAVLRLYIQSRSRSHQRYPVQRNKNARIRHPQA
jgi:uncharacterized protein (DUF4415 family)